MCEIGRRKEMKIFFKRWRRNSMEVHVWCVWGGGGGGGGNKKILKTKCGS